MTAYEKFSKSIHKFGRLSMLLGMIAVLLPPMLMTFYYGLNPGIAAIVTGAISQMSVSGAFYFSEPIANYPIVGAAGLYMSTLSGNSVNFCNCFYNFCSNCNCKFARKYKGSFNSYYTCTLWGNLCTIFCKIF